ncbi:MAG: tRNA (adenosine(37)-N6)-dimethylallyltransferase MiaA [Rhizobiales bacterium]|nr:tRNA (adenosine(37)-N6)-dimethylallyltransferase MiaA [Hyphomicrobiales bacterium]
MTEESALLIAGPTASGKSALAMKLARERRGVIINADALQVYGALRILSARPSEEDERAVPHRRYGHVASDRAYSVGAWLAEAKVTLEEAWDAGLLPIVTGGTGLYFKALEQGIADIPSIPESLRKHWRDFKGDLDAELRARDPLSAERISPTDRQRLIRALEVFEATGRTLGDWHREARQQSVLAGVDVEKLYVMVPRGTLHERAERRFDEMLVKGALEEVKQLGALDPASPIMKAIGVPELRAHLDGEISLEEAATRAKAATRQYIKRQETWFRGQMTGYKPVSGLD